MHDLQPFAGAITVHGETIDPTPLYNDNRAAILVINDPARKPSKAICSRFLHTRDLVHRNIISLNWTSTHEIAGGERGVVALPPHTHRNFTPS